MSDVQHTPGPWNIDDELACVIAAGDTQVTDPFTGCKKDGRLLSHDERKANARLIAAAPDLLAALKQIANESTRNLGSARIVARAAIAKATGQ